MTADTHPGKRTSATTFLHAASRYWLSVFPRIRCESQHWHERAEAIPDPVLRQLALEAHRIKQSNIEGSAAFATFAPSAHRGQAIRAQVAFQSAYDYIDTLAEQPHDQPIANSRQLHQALLAAIDPSSRNHDYYALHPHHDDGGYLQEIVDACRSALNALPSIEAIAAPTHDLTTRIVTYQSLNLTSLQGGHRQLRRWALQRAPQGTGLRWWETAAAAGSSLGVFALIAAGASPDLQPSEAAAIEQAYWPYVGALHSLLDSLVDEAADIDATQRSLLSYYATPQDTATRLAALARNALIAIHTLPDAQHHTLLLSAMASSYLTAPEASSPTATIVATDLLRTLGPEAGPSMALFNARQNAEQLVHGLRTFVRRPGERVTRLPTRT